MGDDWYQISSDGISRMRDGNDIEEIIMDGSSGAMGSPLNTVNGIVPMGDGEFLALYSQTDSGAYSLEHYVYDEDVPSVPEHILTVFGLTKSDTVQQAITQFQKENPDVQVKFSFLGKAGNEVTTEDIRTLNTELLSGNGADVLLLDGLPADSYIEKGMLEDLTDLYGEIADLADYLETVMENTVQSDGKIYGLPVKFSVPLMFGNQDTEQALESLDSLDAYLEANPDADIFGPAKSSYIRDMLFILYQDEVMGEDGKIDTQTLEKLLLTVEKIAENSGEEGDVSYLAEDSVGLTSPFAENEDGLDVMSNADAVGTVGINSASGQKELAEEFVRYLFSDEIQSAALIDGFPVLLSALDGKVQEAAAASGNFAASVAVAGEDGIDMELAASYPEEEEVLAFTELCRTLDTPMEQNRIVWNIYQEEADSFMEGSAGADEAAKNIAQKVDTYLAEQE